MNLYLRLLIALLKGRLGRNAHHAESVESRFRVWLHDMDAFGHMNNGRYLQIMDVARAEWMMRTGVAAAIRQNRWGAVLGGGFIRYRFSLRLFQSYRVQTRLLCWDDRWFFLEHSFFDNHERCVAKGISRAALRTNGQWVSTDDVVAAVHPNAISPEMPTYVRDWLELEHEMFETPRQIPVIDKNPQSLRSAI